MPSKGQNFLIDLAFIKKVISYVDFSKRPIIEVGGGKGALTTLLRPDLTIEIDSSLANYLKDYNLVIADALAPPFFRGQVVSSLPYYITYNFMREMIKNSSISRLVLVLQKDFIDKILNRAVYISFTLHYHFKIQSKDIIPPRAFSPRPRVYSQIVIFERVRGYNQYVDDVLQCVSSYKNKKLNSVAKLCGINVTSDRRVRDFKPWQVIELLNFLGIEYV